MTFEQFLFGYLPIAAAALWLHCYCGIRCTRLDVATGRRDRMALVDDYGSNRGFYWPWSYISIVAFLVAAPGMLYAMALVAVLLFATPHWL